METQQKPTAVQEDALQPQSEHLTPKAFGKTFERVRKRADAGDEHAREVLRKYLDGHPEIAAVVGNMARCAESAVVEAVARGEWFASEALKRESARMRRELAGPTPTPLEAMAIERIILTWTQLQYVETQFIQVQKDLDLAKYWLKRQQQADKIYREAVKSLLLVRALLPAAPAGPPAIVDAGPQAAKPEASDMIEPLYVPVEIRNGHGANRIVDLMARRVADDQVDEPPKLNGHHHRLEELLVNGSDGHSKHGGST